jgi:hypothetical protein
MRLLTTPPTPFSPGGLLNPNVAKVQSLFNANANEFTQQVASALAAVEEPYQQASHKCLGSCECVPPEDGGNIPLDLPIILTYPPFGDALAAVVNASSTPFPPQYGPATGVGELFAKASVHVDTVSGTCKPE